MSSLSPFPDRRSTPRLDGVVTDFLPVRKPAPPATAADLLAESLSAYEAERGAAMRYRHLVIDRAFRERFGTSVEHLRFWRHSPALERGVWTFRVADLHWQAQDDGSGDERQVSFRVTDLDGRRHPCNSKAQLGELMRQGVRLVEPEPAA